LIESDLWASVRANLPDDRTQLCRIENEVGTGISDVNACRDGQERWIELKLVKGDRIYFRCSQRSWITRRTQVGGKVFVLARDGDVLLLYDGFLAATAPSHPYKNGKSYYVKRADLPTPLWSHPKPVDWRGLREKIFGG
jgi:hypothetical protein